LKAAIWTGEQLEITDELEVREPGTDEVTVEIAVAGLCHSDLNPMTGRYPQPVPAVLGHEAVGRVVAVGPGAESLLGTRVVLSPVAFCGACRHCRAGSPTTCTNEPPPPPTPFSLRGRPVNQFVRLGAFARHTVVASRQVIAISDDVPDASAALLGCAIVTGVGAVGRASVASGDVVLVTGAGGVGLNAIQEASFRRAEQIIVCDRNPAKEQIATRLGATDFVVVGDADDIGSAVRDRAPGGADAAIECTGNVAVLEAAIGSLARGGRVVIVGLPGDESMVVPVRSLFHDRSILGCRMGAVDAHRAIPELVDRYLSGQLEIDGLVSRIAPLGEIGSLVDDLRRGELDRGVVVMQ
jgi:S-(hydroxymethyl)glutathione dehydrogenase/alcohol dehydrogenase